MVVISDLKLQKLLQIQRTANSYHELIERAENKLNDEQLAKLAVKLATVIELLSDDEVGGHLHRMLENSSLYDLQRKLDTIRDGNAEIHYLGSSRPKEQPKELEKPIKLTPNDMF